MSINLSGSIPIDGDIARQYGPTSSIEQHGNLEHEAGMRKPALCIGTAQFGQEYGVTNANGKVPERLVTQLLNQASASGIGWLDTAQAYGDAEAVLGRSLVEGHGYRIVSKFAAQSQPSFTAQDVVTWDEGFHRSCELLGVESLDTLLLHAPCDLKKPGANYLEEWLLSLQSRGLVNRLGVSIYSAHDLAGINSKLLGLVQLPLSLFDQRLLQDGTVSNLLSRGAEIHARSLYLQGLLLTPAKDWPTWISAEMRNHHQRLEDLAQHRNCRLIDLALGFAKSQSDLEAVVVGLCSPDELTELQEAWVMPSPWEGCEWQAWGLSDVENLDPRSWRP